MKKKKRHHDINSNAYLEREVNLKFLIFKDSKNCFTFL